MLVDARQWPDGRRADCDVCVIGGGAAGISLALELAGGPLRVVLLESGGLDVDAATDDLSRGRIFGRAYAPLQQVRSRRLGGTTDVWLGRCRPLDPADFEEREWVPHSGWPIAPRDLKPFEAAARRLCGLEGDAAGPDAAGVVLPLDPERFETRALEIAPTRFGARYRESIGSARNLEARLWANAVELVTNESGTAVESVRVATLTGVGFPVRARAVVLAAGGIENARLLLASNRVWRTGIGNRADRVGRFFMEHPQLAAGALLPASSDLRLEAYRTDGGGRARAALLVPSPALLRREGLQSFALQLGGEGALPGIEQALARDVHAFEAAGGEPAARAFFLLNTCEQAPNPASRVRLVDERDALGLPRVQLEWRLGPSDLHSLRRGHELLARELGRAGLGRLQLMFGPGDMDWPPDLGGSGHHMGTTRMHADPQRGVVDAECRVHGVANLYVAGSSVFPTSGAADPTLTIVALALRLARRLAGELA